MGAAAVALAAVCVATPSPAGAGTAVSQEGAKAPTVVPAELGGSAAGISDRLKACHERIARVGDCLLEAIRSLEASGADAAPQVSRVLAAEASEKAARLDGQIVELNLKEHLESSAPAEQASYEKELAQAQDDLKRAMKKRVTAIRRFETIKGLSNGSASDLALEYRYDRGREVAELEQRRAEYAIEEAKSKLYAFKTFKKHQRTKELSAAIERAKRNELAKRSTLHQESARLKDLKGPAEKQELRARDANLLRLLDEAISIDGTVREKLKRLTKHGKTDAGLEKEISGSMNHLESVVERAEADIALARVDMLKAAIWRARSK
jgi:hypothetical protein